MLNSKIICHHKDNENAIGVVVSENIIPSTNEEGQLAPQVMLGVTWVNSENAPIISYHDASELVFVEFADDETRSALDDLLESTDDDDEDTPQIED